MYHWTVKKDWHAHNSPVCGLLLDPSSVWIFKSSSNYLTMIGTDNFTRGWNARRRLAGWTQSRDVEYCNFREIRAAVLTELRFLVIYIVPLSITELSLRPGSKMYILHLESPPEILVFGFQEFVNLENKRVNALGL
ncbi:hypothetical protein V8E54_014019 [Elaphomyces granulatus]